MLPRADVYKGKSKPVEEVQARAGRQALAFVRRVRGVPGASVIRNPNRPGAIAPPAWARGGYGKTALPSSSSTTIAEHGQASAASSSFARSTASASMTTDL